jgi:hypothetical protein
MSKPDDVFFDEEVSTSCADLNVIAPGADRVRTKPLEISGSLH